LNELERLLVEQPKLTERQIRESFLRTLGAQASREAPPALPAEMLRALSLSADDSFRQVAEFVLRLNAIARTESLRDWAVKHVKPTTLAEIERKLVKEAADQIYYLLCWIKDGRFTPVLYRGAQFEFVTRWPPTAFAGRSLDALIEQHLKMAEEYSQNLFIHFLVSRDYFDWSPQSVLVSSALDPQPLGSTYPTVMRWRERALRQARTGHEDWTRRAPQVLECAQAGNKINFCWVPRDLNESGLNELLKAVGAQHQVLAFDFATPRSIREPGNPVIAAIRGGLPIILWPCENPQDHAAIRNALADRAGESNLERLLEQMKAFYQHDARQWKVTLFWDDPKHKPEKWEYHDDF
jgi:vWA-MoxR associated protein C-terminal domain